MSNFLQWGMTLYTANSDTTVSPTVVVLLGTFALLCSMTEVMIDLFYSDQADIHHIDLREDGSLYSVLKRLIVEAAMAGAAQGHLPISLKE